MERLETMTRGADEPEYENILTDCLYSKSATNFRESQRRPTDPFFVYGIDDYR